MMAVLLSYLKRHIKFALLYFLYAFIFIVVFSLYGLPVEAVSYGFVLSVFFTVIFFSYGFTRYYKTHQQLEILKDQVTLSIDTLPDAKDLLVKDYQLLIETLFDKYHALETDSDFKRMAQIDYYTLWVHQIKTPISAMYLLLESNQNENTLSLKSELFKIEQYVEMVLHYQRLESETTDLKIQHYDLESIVKSVIRKYRTLFIEKGIKLNLNISPQQVLTDEKWLSFALEQIVSNAIKYTNQGEISITCLSDSLRLVISDTGIGIQEEDLPRIFEKGFTGFNGRMNRKSTGIGLYLCKQTLKMLGHDIDVVSQLEQGTTVTIGLDRPNITLE